VLLQIQLLNLETVPITQWETIILHTENKPPLGGFFLFYRLCVKPIEFSIYIDCSRKCETPRKRYRISFVRGRSQGSHSMSSGKSEPGKTPQAKAPRRKKNGSALFSPDKRWRAWRWSRFLLQSQDRSDLEGLGAEFDRLPGRLRKANAVSENQHKWMK